MNTKYVHKTHTNYKQTQTNSIDENRVRKNKNETKFNLIDDNIDNFFGGEHFLFL